MSDLVVIDASVPLAIALPDPQAHKEYAMALLFAIDKGDVIPLAHPSLSSRNGCKSGAQGQGPSDHIRQGQRVF